MQPKIPIEHDNYLLKTKKPHSTLDPKIIKVHCCLDHNSSLSLLWLQASKLHGKVCIILLFQHKL